MKKLFGNLLIAVLILGLATFAHAFGKDKFEEELYNISIPPTPFNNLSLTI